MENEHWLAVLRAHILPQESYEEDTLLVAQRLLGTVLVLRDAEQCRAAVITEVEAYCGSEDKACHASRGYTPRTSVMFGPPGFWYVYLIYGMYYCLNIVTEREGYPAAVLIRGAIPYAGFPDGTRLDGPGKLCRAFAIDKRFNATPGFGKHAALAVSDVGLRPHVSEIQQTPRIGVDYAGEYKNKPWRWVWNVRERSLRQKLNEHLRSVKKS